MEGGVGLHLRGELHLGRGKIHLGGEIPVFPPPPPPPPSVSSTLTWFTLLTLSAHAPEGYSSHLVCRSVVMSIDLLICRLICQHRISAIA